MSRIDLPCRDGLRIDGREQGSGPLRAGKQHVERTGAERGRERAPCAEQHVGHFGLIAFGKRIDRGDL